MPKCLEPSQTENAPIKAQPSEKIIRLINLLSQLASYLSLDQVSGRWPVKIPTKGR